MAARGEARNAEEAVRAVRTEWRTRQLLRAAARLMEREGFHGVSMQALADEAEVSVGLIYRYFGGKEDVLLAVIVDVLNAFGERVPQAIAAAGDDPVERITAGFRAYCEVINDHRHAAVLTYRESKTLGEAGREQIKRLEVQTGEPLRTAIREAMESGALVGTDPDLLAYDLLLLAHAWALKHWYFERTLDFDGYVARQAALVLRGAIAPRRRARYRHLLEPAVTSEERHIE
ncbi:TetR/AcrR family transcriptional regulator [Actinomadura sp. DC4]|uniref:TetR/AcrR family transcriptional regulator n=1 Tax=Actinomadura sp. DC4 TaxID=3055069 RepID=UPI0025AF8A42|nr:TetR/AcrR family transcriptional regulator [Actinomadura sp. DC4]MDN3356448.1 TetR/AcrR family transcriptional regulator [Actinomadura sp. DC4]